MSFEEGHKKFDDLYDEKLSFEKGTDLLTADQNQKKRNADAAETAISSFLNKYKEEKSNIEAELKRTPEARSLQSYQFMYGFLSGFKERYLPDMQKATNDAVTKLTEAYERQKTSLLKPYQDTLNDVTGLMALLEPEKK